MQLTGACVAALGHTTAGLFSNSKKLAVELLKAADTSAEPLWTLPVSPPMIRLISCVCLCDHPMQIFEAHRAELLPESSDLRSTGTSKTAGASTAAAFLEHFVEKNVRWAHIDIAGPAMTPSAHNWIPKNGTGYGVQLLAHWLRKRANNA